MRPVVKKISEQMPTDHDSDLDESVQCCDLEARQAHHR